jgi:hypothetical protein
VTYFAYGSNLFRPWLRTRAPSAAARGVARLPGHRLCFHKRGSDDSGKCNALATGRGDDVVYGVVFEIDPPDKAGLDRAEGAPRQYREATVHLVTERREIEAFTYLAAPGWVDDGLRPFDWYRDLVVAGAREQGLPAFYVARIEQVGADPDPDPSRAARARSVLGCS